MTVCFSDGFDSYAATADLKNKWAMAAPTWVFSTAADQNGATGGIVSATNSYLSPLATQTGLLSGTRCGFGFWLKISALPGFNQAIFRADSVNGTGCIRLGIITTGVLWMISGDGGSGIMTGTINVCNNAWHWIELAGQIGTNVNQRLLVDGTSEYNTNATVQGAAITYDHAMFYSVDQRVISLSDVVMIDNTSPVTVAADFPLGARKIITKRQDADDAVQFTRSTGSTNYTLIDEVAGDLTDYVESNSTGYQDTYDYAALGVTPSSVNAVVVNTYLATSTPGVIEHEQVAKSSGTLAVGATVATPPSPFIKQQAFHVDPATSTAWTESGINAAKFGIKVTGTIPAGMLDGVGQLTGAFSFSRNLLSTFSSARYSDTGGAVDSFTNQIAGGPYDSYNLKNVGSGRPTLSTAGPNSRACADFDGTDDCMATAQDIAFLIGTEAGWYAVSMIVDTAALNASLPYENVPVIGCGSGAHGLYIKNPGSPVAVANVYSGVHDQAISATSFATGTPVVLEWEHYTTNLWARVNTGTPGNAATGSNAGMSGGVNLGQAYSANTRRFDGKIFEVVFAGSAPTNRHSIVRDMMTWIGATMPPAFSPIDLGTANLKCWIDFSDTATITATGSAVTQVTDKSGFGQTFIQATSSLQPQTGINTQNGLNVLTFDGGDQLERVSGVSLPTLDGGGYVTIIIVRKITSGTSAGLLWVASNGGSYSDAYSLGREAGNMAIYGNHNADGSSSAAVVADSDNTNWNISSCYSGEAGRGIFHNGVAGGTNAIATDVTTPDKAFIGTTLAYNRASGRNMAGQIGEVIILAGAGTVNRQMCEGYLAWKWGIQTRLASTHPYRYAAP